MEKTEKPIEYPALKEINLDNTETRNDGKPQQSYGAISKADKYKSEKKWWIFPAGFQMELMEVFTLAWPAILSTMFTYMLGPVSLMFCGHLGRNELDGVALAISLLNITGISVCAGLSTACDTLFSQAFGGNGKRMIGIYLQRSILIIGLSCCICWSIHLNAEAILILLGQDREISRIAGEYMLYYFPGLIFNFEFQVLVKYLQNQNIVVPPVYIGFLGNAFNALLQYLAVYVLNGGTRGSALGQALSYFFMCMSTIAYIIISGIYKATWGGVSWKALENWGSFSRLAIAGFFMIAIEWWCFEIGIVLNGILGEVELGATAVIFQLESFFYNIPVGISIACSIRVGQSLGAGNSTGAKLSARVSQSLAWMIYMIIAILVLSLSTVLPSMFTEDRNVLDLASSTLPIVVIVMFWDSITCISMGILRGCGRQFVGAVCNVLGYIVFAVPLSAVMMFVLRIGSKGFWWGLVLGTGIISFVYLVIIGRTDWQNEVQKAKKRIIEARRRRITLTDESPLFTEETDLQPETVDTDATDMYLMSTSIELSTTESLGTSMAMSQKLHLVLKRCATGLAVLAILAVGLMIRLFVPLPSEDWVVVVPINSTALPWESSNETHVS